MHPLVAYSAENLSALPLRAALSLPIAVITLLVIEPCARPTSPGRDRRARRVSLLGAWLINFFTMALVGTLAFFLESSTAIFEIWLVAFMLLSGYLVPLELFPAWLRDLATALPFRYTLAFPVEVLTGMAQGAASRSAASPSSGPTSSAPAPPRCSPGAPGSGGSRRTAGEARRR